MPHIAGRAGHLPAKRANNCSLAVVDIGGRVKPEGRKSATWSRKNLRYHPLPAGTADAGTV